MYNRILFTNDISINREILIIEISIKYFISKKQAEVPPSEKYEIL